MRVRVWFVATILLCAASSAADAPPEGGGVGAFPDFFNAESMRRPVPGEWVEYRVAFPTDQLENSLRPDPAPGTSPDTAGAGISDVKPRDFVPAFDAPSAWRVLPLRVEVREVSNEGCNVILTFGGMTHVMFLPRAPENAPDADFTYDEPKEGDDRRFFIKIADEEVEVESVRRASGDAEGFIRWTNERLPFGLARLATPDVDIVLVAQGRGTPPEFPLPAPVLPDPPLGRLWGGE